LLPNVGVIEMQLLEETKMNWASVADVVMAHTALASKLFLGTWMDRMKCLWQDWNDPGVPFLQGSNGWW
jgi:hypothetical protein